MKRLDLEAALFATKCLVAAVLAFYAAASLGLSRPYWAVATSFIVAQPFSGAVLSKAIYRLAGTLLGATAAVVMVPTFVNEPYALSLAMALWLGACVYLALLDRSARSYIFLLAGYTASIIGFPSVDVPGTIFMIAAERVQEISIGILAGSLVHGSIFPRTVSARLLDRIDMILTDAERWSLSALSRGTTATVRMDHARLIADLDELDQLSINLPFDTARIVPSRRAVRSFQDHLSLLLPLASTVEDRLSQLRLTDGGVPSAVSTLIADVAAWLGERKPRDDELRYASALVGRAHALASLADGEPIWREMLILSLLARLSALIAGHRDCRVLRDRIKAPHWRDGVAELLSGGRRRVLRSDRGLAVRGAAGTMTAILLASVFWIETSWVDGDEAALIAGICCALYGNLDRPTPTMFRFFAGAVAGLIVSGIYAFAILPQTTDYTVVAAVFAPAFLLLGSMFAHPETLRFAQGGLLAFPNMAGLDLSYSPDFHSFINTAVAQAIGVGFATAMLGLFHRTDDASHVARIQRACFRDIVWRVEGHFDDSQWWLERMLDRVGLLLPHLSTTEAEGNLFLHALKSLRIGYVAGELGTLGNSVSEQERALITTALQGIGSHFRSLDPVRPASPPQKLLVDLDRVVAAFARGRRTRTSPARTHDADQSAAQSLSRRSVLPSWTRVMIGEVSIGGVYFPVLLLLGLAALAMTGLVTRIMAALGVYRFVVYRPAVDGSLFVILLGMLALAAFQIMSYP
ncbi:MAG: FUSC family protein [Aliidongia sp.]